MEADALRAELAELVRDHAQARPSQLGPLAKRIAETRAAIADAADRDDL